MINKLHSYNHVLKKILMYFFRACVKIDAPCKNADRRLFHTTYKTLKTFLFMHKNMEKLINTLNLYKTLQ